MRAAEVFDLTGKVVWVTGSSRGIGRGVAEHLSAHGAAVVLHGRDRDRLEPVGAGFEGEWLAVTGDVRDRDQVAAAVGEIHERFGRLDGLVANVGAAFPGPADSVEPKSWDRTFAINVDGAFYAAQAAHPLLQESGGSIVFISSTAAIFPTPNFSAYGAAKAAVEHITKSLAAEWGPAVRVNCVSPGIVMTEGSAQAVFGGDEEKVSRVGATTAVGRVGLPEDIAWACHFLLSPAASYVDGHVLVVDGGEIEGPADRLQRAVRGG